MASYGTCSRRPAVASYACAFAVRDAGRVCCDASSTAVVFRWRNPLCVLVSLARAVVQTVEPLTLVAPGIDLLGSTSAIEHVLLQAIGAGDAARSEAEACLARGEFVAALERLELADASYAWVEPHKAAQGEAGWRVSTGVEALREHTLCEQASAKGEAQLADANAALLEQRFDAAAVH